MGPEARFCSHCGGRLEGPGAAVISRAARAEVMSTLRGEERLVTVVFADLTESVSRTSALSPEEATGLVNPLLEAMVELIVRYDGRIDRFLGDGVLAVFGVPCAHEDDPMRAVRAAVELRERATAMGLAVTIGINTGRVYFGPVGSSLHEELTVMGPAVNLAARLQGAASSDEILIGEATRAHVEKAFHLSPVTLSIKGIDGAVTAYRAEHQVDHPDKVRGIGGLRADVVGRDDEMGTLRAALEGDSPGSVALVGPAGVGKSRLAAELNVHASRRNAVWLEGRCRQDTIHMPYGPIVDLFRRRFGTTHTTASVLASVKDLVAADTLEDERAEEMAPFLAHLLGEPIGDASDLRVGESNPDTRRHLTVAAIIDYLVATARLRPTVLFLDDLHWSDDASLRVVEALHRRPDDVPITTVIAFRPDAEAPTAGLPERLMGLTVLNLRRLTPAQSAQLIRRLLETSGIPESLEDTIVTNSDGNPFYVEEIIRSYIQRGMLVAREGGWEATGEIDTVSVPESVEGIIMSRFDRLPGPVKLASRVASVLGHEFSQSQLRGMGTQLPAQLPAMVDAGIAAPLREGDDPEYGFLHALTRQAIYSSLLPSHRVDLHGRAAASLEDTGSDELDRLAHHYEHSQHDDKAIEYLLAAAERALATYANDTARRHLEAGLNRIHRLPTDEQAPWRARYRARLGELLERQADHDGARTELRAALIELGDDPYEEGRLLCLLGRTHRLQGAFDDSHHCYDRAEAALGRVPDPDSTRAHRAWIEIQQERSHALYFGGRGLELPDHNDRLAAIVETHGSVAQKVDFRRAVAMDGFVRDRFRLDGAAVDHARGTLELARTGADPGRLAETSFVLGFTLLWADVVEEAVEVLAGAVSESARIGDVTHELRSRSYHAIALRRTGRVDEAAEAARRSLDLATSIDDSYYQGHALATLCWVGWRRDDGTCRPLGEDAYRMWGEFERSGHRGYETEFVWMAAWPVAADAHRRGDHDRAITELMLLGVPWERPMPADLAAAVDAAIARREPGAMATSMGLARRHLLL